MPVGLELAALRTGAALAGALPAAVSRSLGEGVAVAVGRASAPFSHGRARGGAMARRREMVARHLVRVCGSSLDGRRLERMVDAAFASYGRYWAECLRLPSLTPSEVVGGLESVGEEWLERALEQGRGAVVALPHLGGWDWGGAYLAVTGRPVSVVVEELDPPEVFEWFLSFRRSLGMEVIPAGPGAGAACLRALHANRVLCLICDRVVGGSRGVEVDLFGERTELPGGPALLALRTGAALLPAAAYFDRAGRHRAVLMPPMHLARRGRLSEDVRHGTQALARVLEDLIREAPTQWHLMQPNWPSDYVLG